MRRRLLWRGRVGLNWVGFDCASFDRVGLRLRRRGDWLAAFARFLYVTKPAAEFAVVLALLAAFAVVFAHESLVFGDKGVELGV